MLRFALKGPNPLSKQPHILSVKVDRRTHLNVSLEALQLKDLKGGKGTRKQVVLSGGVTSWRGAWAENEVATEGKAGKNLTT